MQLVRQKTRRKVLRKGYINMTCFANTVFQCLFGFWVASSKDSCSTSTCGIVMILKPFPAQNSRKLRASSAVLGGLVAFLFMVLVLAFPRSQAN